LHEDYIIRWFEDSDSKYYIAGMKKNLFLSYNEKRFRWKFIENPARLPFTSIVAVESRATGKPVGFNGFLPMRLRMREESFLVVQGVDGYVEPEHRGKGLFAATIEFMAQRLGEDGPELLVGFNVPAATAAAVRAGSVQVGIIHDTILKKPRRWRRKANGKSVRREDSARIEIIPCGIREVNRVYEEWAKNASHVHTHRSPEYLTWRILKDPVTRYECYLIEVEGGDRGYVVSSTTTENDLIKLTIDDYMILDNDYNVLSRTIEKLATKQERLNTVEIRMFPNEELEHALLEAGFRTESKPAYSLILKPLSKSIVGENTLTRGDVKLSQLSSWYLTNLDIL